MTSEHATWKRSTDIAIVTILVLAAAVTFSKDIAVGGLRWSDSNSRAMDGVLIHDWVSAGPDAWSSPLEFAKRQYAHYPTLSIGRVYPPGFAIVESAFFAVFGISPFTARLCTLCFGLLAVAGCYALTRKFMTPLAATCATGFLIGMPGVVFWSRLAMLEMPALAMLIWTVYAAHGYFEKPTWLRWAAVVFLTLASVLVKQTTVFIVPVLGVFFVWRVVKERIGTEVEETARIPGRHVVAILLSVVLPLGAFFAYTFFSGGSTTHMFDVVSMGKPISEWLSWDALAFYWPTLPRQASWLLLALAALGFLSTLLPLRHRAALPSFKQWEWWLILAWFLVYYLMVTLIQYKEGRYFFFNYFPLAVWAGWGAATLIGFVPLARVRAAVAAALVIGVVIIGYQTPLRYEPDYSPLIATYESQIRNNIVLFEGLRDGDFTFAARRQLGKRQCVVVRGSKVFYSCPAIAWFDFKSEVSSTDDVARIIDKFGFELMFVERRNLLHLKEIDLLHEELANRDRYELVGSHKLTVPRPNQGHRARVVDVYRPLHRSARRTRFLDIPIPIDGRTIRVNLDDLLTPDA